MNKPINYILVVDDDPDARALLHALTSNLGYEIREAANGVTALELARKQLPVLVLLDQQLGSESGTTLIPRLKELPEGEKLPVIMVTADERVESKVKAFEHGADDYIAKPFHHRELQVRLQAVLRHRALLQHIEHQRDKLIEMQEIIRNQERSVVLAQIAATAAHQIGQPLSSLLLTASLIKEQLAQHIEISEQAFVEHIQRIIQDAERIADLIQALKHAHPSKTEHYFKDIETLLTNPLSLNLRSSDPSDH